MERLRNLSRRPHVLVDHRGRGLTDADSLSLGDSRVTTDLLGRPGPFGRERVVSALPLNKTGGAVQLRPTRVLHDAGQCYIADPDGYLLGRPALWVHRMAYAAKTENTRRL